MKGCVITLLLEALFIIGKTEAAVERHYNFVIERKIKILDGKTTIVNVVNDMTTSPVIHVRVGDVLSVNVTNLLPDHGMSIHWHGFEMKGKNIYDGVVGVTQCAIAPGESFVYRFLIDEIPGTYWWHTHSGEDPVAHDLVRGPLIVHPQDTDDLQPFPKGYSYSNERIIFLQDVPLHLPGVAFAHHMSGFYGQPSRDEEGFTVGLLPWRGGYINGHGSVALIEVKAGETYRFRVINGGSVYPYHFGIDGMKLVVVGTDGSPCVPYEVDQIYIHTAERFDFLLHTPRTTVDQLFWIRALTSESRHQGFTNSIKSILMVKQKRFNNLTASKMSAPSSKPAPNPVILNCHAHSTSNSNRCKPLTALKPAIAPEYLLKPSHMDDLIVHTIDTSHFGAPRYSHMMRVDGGVFVQHMNPSYGAILHPNTTSEATHPHQITLKVPLNKTLVIVFRTDNPFAHPMHIHGHKFEVLAIGHRHPTKECNVIKCPFIDVEEMFGVSVRELGKRPEGIQAFFFK